MIDTHAHIDTEAFDSDREELIIKAKNKGIEAIIVPATEKSGFGKIMKLAQENDIIYCSMGIHPHSALEANDAVYNEICELAEHDKVVAIGEIGLDYYYDFAPKEVQKDVFRRQLQIAKDKKVPAIIHNRESDDDLLSIIKDEQNGNLKGVLHCFSSNIEFMKKALDLGMNISFTGNITFKKSNLDDVVKEAPLDKIMIETDSPYMTPVPYRGKRNDPTLVKHVAEKIAEIKSISIDEVIEMTKNTAKKFFNLTLLLILLLTVPVFSQDDEEEEYYEEVAEQLDHPYPKFIGAGPIIGTNTIVQTIKYDRGDERTVSYEGILAIGGSVLYSPIDILLLETSYVYSKNTKIAEQNVNIEPTVYNQIEIVSNWIANPYNRVNFFGTVGMTALFTEYSNWIQETGIVEQVNTFDLAITPGLGFMVNLDFTDVGLFVFKAEWRLNFLLGDDDIVERQSENVFLDATRSSFFSIPRASIIFFPDLW